MNAAQQRKFKEENMFLSTFTNTYGGADIKRILSDLKRREYDTVQLNLISCGMEMLPKTFDEKKLSEISALSKETGVKFISLAGTCNLIDPDADALKDNLERFKLLCEIAEFMDIPIITLCTGTKNPHDRWEWHDDNAKPESFDELLRSTDVILKAAEKHGIKLLVEPEMANVVTTPEIARKYLDTYKSEYLKIVFDAANIYNYERYQKMYDILEESIALLAKDIVQAHAKDFEYIGKDFFYRPAGKGCIDFKRYFSLLKKYGFDDAVVMHGLKEEDMDFCTAKMREAINNA